VRIETTELLGFLGTLQLSVDIAALRTVVRLNLQAQLTTKNTKGRAKTARVTHRRGNRRSASDGLREMSSRLPNYASDASKRRTDLRKCQ